MCKHASIFEPPLEVGAPVVFHQKHTTEPQDQYFNLAQPIATHAGHPLNHKVVAAPFKGGDANQIRSISNWTCNSEAYLNLLKPSRPPTMQWLLAGCLTVTALNRDRSTVHEQVYATGPQCN